MRNFVHSLRTVPVYIVPALIDAFNLSYVENEEPATLQDLVDGHYSEGTLFATMDGGDFSFYGTKHDGQVIVKENNSGLYFDYDPSTRIKWIF